MRSQSFGIAICALLTLGCESGVITETYQDNLRAYTSAPTYAIETFTIPYDSSMGGFGRVYRTSVVTRIVNYSPGSVDTWRCQESDSAPAHTLRRDDGYVGIFSPNRPCLGLSGPTIPSGGERVDTLVFADTFYCCHGVSMVGTQISGQYRISFVMGDLVLQTNRFRLTLDDTP